MAEDLFEKLVKGTDSKKIGTPPETKSEVIAWMTSPVGLISEIGFVYFALVQAGVHILPD